MSCALAAATTSIVPVQLRTLQLTTVIHTITTTVATTAKKIMRMWQFLNRDYGFCTVMLGQIQTSNPQKLILPYTDIL